MMKEWLAMFFLSILIYKVAGIVSRSVLGTNDAFQYARSRCKRFKMESSARSRTQIVCYTLIAAATKSFLSGKIQLEIEWQVPIGCLLIFYKKSGVFLIFGDDRMLAVAHGRGVYCDDEGVAYGDGLCGAYVAFNGMKLKLIQSSKFIIEEGHIFSRRDV
ncbi:uncharacterized protein LOC123888795 isoform X3 [Trifolium pratense]|uniref:uncharacterized protein LOC123888795 isoform X3 n=1 Tax=Trifolium pratense TaxID=57577 RepID=UPI001E6953CD|nr:uncharacterized protein LOC123888795 isoform X3 [Trifolium pratense]